jgi:hypothetical protein
LHAQKVLQKGQKNLISTFPMAHARGQPCATPHHCQIFWARPPCLTAIQFATVLSEKYCTDFNSTRIWVRLIRSTDRPQILYATKQDIKIAMALQQAIQKLAKFKRKINVKMFISLRLVLRRDFNVVVLK